MNVSVAHIQKNLFNPCPISISDTGIKLPLMISTLMHVFGAFSRHHIEEFKNWRRFIFNLG